jgi:lipopolysaccharide transport system permease protein
MRAMSATEIASRPAWIENRPTRGWRGLDWRELWQFRELVWFFALRDVKVRYKQAAFGAAWAVLQPLTGAIAFTIVFRHLARVPSDGIPYVVFAFAGFVVWTYVSTTITNATDSLVANSALVTKVYFPRIAAPVAAVLPGLIDMAVSLVALAVLMLAFSVTPTLAILTAPLWLAAAIAVALGVGVLLATVQVRFRDARYANALALQLWLFVSPIAYPARLVPGGWRYLYACNPLVAVLGGMRWALVGAPAPDFSAVAIGAAVTVTVCVAAASIFARAERRFADVI